MKIFDQIIIASAYTSEVGILYLDSDEMAEEDWAKWKRFCSMHASQAKFGNFGVDWYDMQSAEQEDVRAWLGIDFKRGRWAFNPENELSSCFVVGSLLGKVPGLIGRVYYVYIHEC